MRMAQAESVCSTAAAGDTRPKLLFTSRETIE